METIIQSPDQNQIKKTYEANTSIQGHQVEMMNFNATTPLIGKDVKSVS